MVFYNPCSDTNLKKEFAMHRYVSIIFFLLIAILMFSTQAGAKTDNHYMISLRGALTPGNEVTETYKSGIVDFRYFVSEKFDFGISYEHSEDHPIEMTNEIEELATSGEIDGTARTRVIQLFSVYHPVERSKKLDFYFGAGLKYYLLDADDEESAAYDLKIDTPNALGLAVKVGTHWHLNKNWALTTDGEVGQVYNDYSVKDRMSGMSDNLTTPHYNGNISFGVSYFF
jgi:outer membrane protein W